MMPLPQPAHHREGGYILLLVLVALVAMMISGIALVRSMDTSQLVAGNLASRNATIHSADAAVQTAVTWLQAQSSGTLNADASTSGYFAEDLEGNWVPSFAFSQCTGCVGTDATGNQVSWVVHRMSTMAGNTSANGNYSSTLTTSGTPNTSNSSDTPTYNGTQAHFYRVTVQVRDTRNTTTVIQSFITM
jgi:type IV pilus assembly protein PilX